MSDDEFTDDFGNVVAAWRFRWQRAYWRLGYALTSDNDRVTREHIDFSIVPAWQGEMHGRLEDWAQWCRGRNMQDVSPGFGLHQSDHWDERQYGAATRVPIVSADAIEIAKGVALLPERERQAIQWYYQKGAKKPMSKARELAVSIRGLRDLVDAGRQIMINRGI
jgi:hypothetical protein